MNIRVRHSACNRANGFAKGDTVSSFENFARIVRKCASALSGVRPSDDHQLTAENLPQGQYGYSTLENSENMAL